MGGQPESMVTHTGRPARMPVSPPVEAETNFSSNRPEALEQLEELYDFIADAGSPGNAAGFTESIASLCETLANLPHRGKARDHPRPWLRTMGYTKHVVIAYAVLNETVAIVRICARSHFVDDPKACPFAEQRLARCTACSLLVTWFLLMRPIHQRSAFRNRAARQDGVLSGRR